MNSETKFGASAGAPSRSLQPLQPLSFQPKACSRSLDARDAAKKKRFRRGNVKPKRGRAQSKPTPLETKYQSTFGSLSEPLIREARRELLDLRGSDLNPERAREVLERMQARLDRMLPAAELARLAETLVAETQAWNARQVRKQLALDEVGIKVPELTGKSLERLAKHAVQSIRGIPEEIARRAGPLITDATFRGLRAEAFADELGKRLGISRQEAQARATGLVVRVNAEVTIERHTKLGVNEYIWRASPDSLTRWWHRDLNGKRFRYDNPPMGGGAGPKDRGNPGTATNKRGCRCQAIPVF